MFNVGEYFLYSSQGICVVDDVCDHEVEGVKRKYYVFHPIGDEKSKIMTPVDNKKVLMRPTISKKEAEEIISYFQNGDNISWTDDKKIRNKEFTEAIRQGSAKKNAEILKLLMIKKKETEKASRKNPAGDEQLIASISKALFNELSIVLDSNVDAITQQITERTLMMA